MLILLDIDGVIVPAQAGKQKGAASTSLPTGANTSATPVVHPSNIRATPVVDR